MVKRPALSLLAVALIATGLLSLLIVRSLPDDPQEIAAEPSRSAAPQELQDKPDVSSPEPPPRPEIDAELDEKLRGLRDSYAADGSKANRFRMMKELSELWADAPPVDLFLFEATDPEAPPEYRRYFAHRLRNIGKAREGDKRSELSSIMRAALAGSQAGGPDLALTLIAFDDTPENVRAVQDQIALRQDDEIFSGYLAALTQSGSPQALEILIEETHRMSKDPDRHLLSLRAALPPLAREPDLEIGPEIREVLVKTRNREIFETALECCFVRQPETPAIQSIAAALERSSDFETAWQPRINRLIRTGLQRWRAQLPTTSSPEIGRINRLLSKIP